ncbi:HK97-gp10 family putative phage morphogenesis protein [Deinococcus aquatilis]|uniref:HK97-gp10 family putative phage morphogenesis protein n=1 Tax=Deinococcus aquatilis TaxID=519440 RepID=UPI0003684A2C|nr:HK97-gp10 family putative phage morphogenesis protein [Deinococcus aquatilis]
MGTFRAQHIRVAVIQLAEQRAAVKAQQLRNEMVLLAPVDTGRLRQSINVQKIGKGHYRVGTNVNYAPFVEFGTRYMRAQPFMRPAIEKVFPNG